MTLATFSQALADSPVHGLERGFGILLVAVMFACFMGALFDRWHGGRGA